MVSPLLPAFLLAVGLVMSAAPVALAQEVLPTGTVLELRGRLPDVETRLRCAVFHENPEPAPPGTGAALPLGPSATDCDVFGESEGDLFGITYGVGARCLLRQDLPPPTGEEGLHCWEDAEFLEVGEDMACSAELVHAAACEGGAEAFEHELLAYAFEVAAACDALLPPGAPPPFDATCTGDLAASLEREVD